MNSVTAFGLGQAWLPVLGAAVDAEFDTSGIDISSEQMWEIRGGSVHWDGPSLNEAGTTEAP